ncbi:alpha-1,2-mannosidase, putative subfamily [Violaceomyces palustris]|uniref:Alpha-1,2-mannosidase, putative subfamily n=1 Tax=Violaceomyces palustris TaxID=1673888 RepID=A0ACD0P449_9BASI|nr:alpha-1,2-mannosidase, putative subfamily [Violaceomyces palustris]
MLFFGLLFSCAILVHGQPAKDLTAFVDPFIGTINGGHVFAGATTPFGSVKAVADTAGGDNQGGFVSDFSAIYGISQLHDDGTGGSPSLGNFMLLPQACHYSSGSAKSTRISNVCLTNKKERVVHQVKGSQKASPGFFSLDLENGIKTAVTTTNHVALHKFDFSAIRDASSAFGAKGKQSATVLFDLTSDLPGQYMNNSRLDIDMNGSNARITAFGEFGPSFGTGSYKVYSCADIPGVSRAATYANNRTTDGTLSLSSPRGDAGALVEIDDDYLKSNDGVISVRVGISWVSVEAACAFAEAEIPNFETAFESIREKSREAWNQILGAFDADLTGVSKEQNRLFWSSLYRTFISPTNVTGDNPRWEGGAVWDSLYCLWDSARVVHPLYAILNPKAQAEIVQAAINVWKHLGFLPDCRMSTDKGFTQGGSNAEMMLSDSYVKGIREGIDWEEGLAAMLKDAEVESADWGVEGRGAVRARKRLGYVPRGPEGSPKTFTSVAGRSASRTLEYAFNDFSIALVAAGQGRQDIFEDFIRRSNDSFNLWNPKVESDGFLGFMQARWANGSFHFQDPRKCSPAFEFGTCYLLRTQDTDFYEASAWQYSLFVPHDMSTLVKLMGGDETYLERVDHMWGADYGDVGDEVGFLPTYVYHYARNGYKRSVDRSLKILRENFNTTYGGLPGNDDSGAMGAYVVWSAMGLFPVAGTGVYLLSTPLFPGYKITSTVTGKTFELKTKNWDEASVNKYIVRATLNGEPYTKNWIEHGVFLEGSTLELTLGPDPTDFGSRVEDLPPSLSTGGFKFNGHAAQGF